MPKLSYPTGRNASARTEVPKDEKSNSIKLTDGVVTPPVEEEEGQTPDVRVAPQGDDASVAFQKQIDDLRKAEQVQKDRNTQLVKENEEAVRRANERDAEVSRLKKTNSETELESISNALVAATASAEAAQSDLEKAFEIGDYKGQAIATRRLSKANTDIARLEDGKVSMELQAQEAAAVAATAKAAPEAPKNLLAALPPLVQNWLEAHQDYLNVPEKNAQVNYLHHVVIREGHRFDSPEYITSMEEHLGMRNKTRTKGEQEEDEYDEPQPRTRSSMVSAPVSRDPPADSRGERPGQVRLSVAQKEAAKIAGISEKDYAEQVLKLRNEKLNGNYGGAP